MSNVRKYENPFGAAKNENKSHVSHSGNSDVDVYVEVNTMPVAYAMLCSLLATKQLSKSEFDEAVKKLKSLVDDDVKHDKNDPYSAKLYRMK